MTKIFKLIKTPKFVVAQTATLILALAGGLAPANPAFANDEMQPIINLEGNVLATEATFFEVGQRIERFKLALETAPLLRVRSTTRTGYSFGGWSYRPGDAAIKTLESSSHTTTRVFLYAVWNTKINLDSNGASSGRPPGESSTLDYRFGQTLTLPSGGSLKKLGLSFAGWTLAPNSGVVTSTYRAASDALGTPTVFAVWKKTISFKSKGSTGAVPAPVTIFEGGSGIVLPTAAALSRPGFEFKGWKAKAGGKAVKNSTSYLPKKANVTLRAIWKKTR